MHFPRRKTHPFSSHDALLLYTSQGPIAVGGFEKVAGNADRAPNALLACWTVVLRRDRREATTDALDVLGIRTNPSV